MADNFKLQKQYSKAAFIHLKLLQQPTVAASVLEEGTQYGNAAHVYLNICRDKNSAARCYEKGRLLKKAIDIYKELNDFEKVGDLYKASNQSDLAITYYKKKIDELKGNKQFVKMAVLYRAKLDNYTEAQSSLILGWIQKRDAYNCLTMYFANVKDENILLSELERVTAQHVTQENVLLYLNVLKNELDRSQLVLSSVRNIAYLLVSKYYDKDKSIINELQYFNKHNTEILSDIQRFKIFKK